MTDRYPPFRFDAGDDEPHGPTEPAPVIVPGPAEHTTPVVNRDGFDGTVVCHSDLITGGRGRAWVLVAFSIALLGGCVAPPEQPATTDTTVTRTVETTVTITPTATWSLARSEPTELWIPRIEARSSLIPLGLNKDGTVEVPPVEHPMQAGWYSLAPTPGEVGPAVILGHVDGNRMPGIFYRLHELVPGDNVEISRMDGSVARFVVRKVDQVAKAQFPTEEVYGETVDPELRLITCGGRFDRTAHSYVDNIIIYATLS